MIVPMTALMAMTASETVNVSWSAATAWGEVIASTNAPSPSETERHRTAAMGMRTSRPR